MPELGYGWHAAVIDSQEELDYIYTQQQKWGDDHSYWIGGSVISDGSHVFTFNFSDYRQSQYHPDCCEYQVEGHMQGHNFFWNTKHSSLNISGA